MIIIPATVSAYEESGVLPTIDHVVAGESIGTAPHGTIIVAYMTIPEDKWVDSYVWTFGDGSSETTAYAGVLHYYENPGTYDVSLTIKGPWGEATKTRYGGVTVLPPETEWMPRVNDLIIFRPWGTAPHVTQFKVFVDMPDDKSYDSCEWTFGDGTSLSEGNDPGCTNNPFHTYENPGVYDVSFTIRGPWGEAKKTVPDCVTVVPPIPGVIYKDENDNRIFDYIDSNGNGEWDTFEETLDTPIPNAFVMVRQPGDSQYPKVKSDANGKFTFSTAKGDYYYDIGVSHKVDGKETIEIKNPKFLEFYSSNPPNQINISIDYLPVNYGSTNPYYELWHRGPVFDKENVLLVHGVQLFLFGSPDTHGEVNNRFGNLAPLLQNKKNGQYNVWEFEYGDEDTGYTYTNLETDAQYLAQAIQKVNDINSDQGTHQNVDALIAHSMGGIISRKTLQDTPSFSSVKLLTLSTAHFGFETTAWADNIWLYNREAVKDMYPAGSYLWDLNFKYTRGQNTIAEMVDYTDAMVKESSASLIESPSDPTQPIDFSIPSYHFKRTVAGVGHGLNDISKENAPAFPYIKDFLGNDFSRFDTTPPNNYHDNPQGWRPYILFCVEDPSVQPQIGIIKDGIEIERYASLNLDSKGERGYAYNSSGLTQECTIWMYNVPADSDIDSIRIYSGENYVPVEIRHGQSMVVKTLIENPHYPLPGYTNPPTDPDSDGLYEDLNANGFADWDDAVVLFWNTDWIQENEPLAAFDFNHNGFIDWDDAVVLFWEV